MFPIRDDQPRFSTPYVNYFIIALNVLIYVFFEIPVQMQGGRHFEALIFQFGFVPELMPDFWVATVCSIPGPVGRPWLCWSCSSPCGGCRLGFFWDTGF